jgi:hypothetical protein
VEATTATSTRAETAVATMTDLGRTARWGSAALVAPLAAAALAAATSWGAAHPPAGSGKNSSTEQAADPDAAEGGAVAAGQETPLDKHLLFLQQRAMTEQASVLHLEKKLNRLKRRTRAIARAPIPGVGGGSSTAGVVSANGGQISIAGPPRVQAAPAPAPPATHSSTGAS